MKPNWVFRRGDIYIADLGHPVGSQQGGIRPVIVLQNNRGNAHSPTVTVAPMTTKTEKKKFQPTHYRINNYKAVGLAYPTMVLAEQIGTFDKSCIVRYLGRVSPTQMRDIDEVVQAQLGFYIPAKSDRRWHYRNGKVERKSNYQSDCQSN